MDDTDRVTRQPIMPPPPTQDPLVRAGSAGGFDEPTPTTRPSWGPPPPVRLARGTLAPPVGRARPDAPAIAPVPAVAIDEPPASRPALTSRATVSVDLPVRLIATPRRWGRVERIHLDDPAMPHWAVAGALAAASSEIEGATVPFVRTRLSLVEHTEPVERLGINWRAIGAGTAALAVLVVMAVALAGRGSDRAAASPADRAATRPAPVVTPMAKAAASDDDGATPVVVEPVADEPAIEIEPIEMEPMDVAQPAPVVARRAPAAPSAAARPARPGVLMVSAKPPCRIVVDGRDTGLMTPQRDVRMAPGRHVVTLVNDEHGIRDRSTVTVPAGGSIKLVRDLTEQML